MKASKLLAAATLAAVIGGVISTSHAAGQTESSIVPKRPDVVFVPTPQPVVNAMLKLANVKQGEKVYDLGCGDGRSVITAARDFGAHGIGIDIDPTRIAESQENAKEAGMTRKVQFRQEDLFKTNFADADVLFLYLLPSLNVRLRPRILEELRPGTRVVSHAFDMGDWEADQTDETDGETIYYWVVPAKVAGEWQVTLPEGKKATLALTQEFQKVEGEVKVDGTSLPITDGRLNGDRLTFAFGKGGERRTADFKITGQRLAGDVQQVASDRTREAWSGQLSQPGVASSH